MSDYAELVGRLHRKQASLEKMLMLGIEQGILKASDIPEITTECREAADAIKALVQERDNLRGGCSVLADVLWDAHEVTKVIEADDSDEHESLWQLNYAIATALAPYKPIPKDSVESGAKK